MQSTFITPKPLSENARQMAQHKFDHVAKPLNSLGRFESFLTQIAAIQGTDRVSLDPRAVLIFCGDHGVVRQGISQCGSDVTSRVARSICEGTSNINLMANCAHAAVFAYDMGIADPPDCPNLIRMSVARGTNDFTQGPAMSREQAVQAIDSGIRAVRDLDGRGFHLLALGEMGIGNTTSSAALTAALLHLSPETVTGRGSGLSDEGLARKIRVIRRGIEVNHTDVSDPVSVLSALGGFEIAGMAGACLGAAEAGIPIILDGVISCVAALIAVRICPAAGAFLIASHAGKEPSSRVLLEALNLSPVLDARMALGEGTGAVMLFPLLDMVHEVYQSSHTFDALDMEAYRPLGGQA